MLNVPVLALWLVLAALVVGVALAVLPALAVVGVLPLTIALAWRSPARDTR